MNKLTLLTLITSLFLSFISTAQERSDLPLMNERWYKLNNMLDKEIRTIKSVRNPGPNLLHRIVELKTQKIELIHEKENKLFLQQAIEQGDRTKSRSEYFKGSQSLYRKTRELGLKIAEEYENYIDIDNVYYTLAINERDYAQNQRIEEFLNKSLKYSRHPETRHRTLVELGEFLYNEKRYDEAINVYQGVINNSADEWQAKHHFNLAWCHYQKNQREKGIELLHRAFRMGREDDYVTLEDQVLNSLSLFYIQVKREKDGVSFLKSLDKEINTEMLIYMANLAQNQGSFQQTIYILNSAIELAKAQGQYDQRIRAYILALDIYRNAKDYDNYRLVSQSLLELYKNGHFNDENDMYRLEAIEKIKGLAGYFQIQVDKQSKFYPEKFNTLEAPLLSDALFYFDLLIEISPEDRDDYLFYKGETLVTSGHYQSALVSYRESFDQALEFERDKETLERTMNSLLATLGEIEAKRLNIESANQWRFTRYAYHHHIRLWPQSERTRKILPKYFTLDLELENFDRAENILRHYHRLFPSDLKIQQELAIQIMDEYVDRRMPQKVNSWIQVITNGFLDFDQKYIDRSIEVLGGLLFEHFREKENKENSLEHISGYEEIYFNEVYPHEIRSEAAFHIARINTQNARPKESYKWLIKLKEIIPRSELENFGMAINGMINELARQSDLSRAADLANSYLDHHCQSLPVEIREDQFEMLMSFRLASNDTGDTMSTIQKLHRCGISKDLIVKHLNNLVAHASFYEDYRLYQGLFQSLWRYPELREVLTKGLISFYWKQIHSSPRRASNTYSLLVKAVESENIGQRNRKEIHNIQNYKQYQSQVQSIIRDQLSPQALGSRFPNDFADENFQDVFEQQLDRTFDILDQVQEMSQKIISYSHPEMIVLPYKYMSNAYESSSVYFKNFAPKNVPDYLEEAFSQQIADIANFLSLEASDISQVGREIINDQEVISADTLHYMTPTSKILNQINFNSTLYSHTHDHNLTTNSPVQRSIAGK